MTKFEALKEALKKVDNNQSKLARICGVTPQAVSKWLNQTKELPVIYCVKVQLDTGVHAHYLQPAFFPPPPNNENISGEYADEYGNPQPILDKQLNGAAA